MPVRPRLAEVHCEAIRFKPGDRVIVRSYHRLDRERRRGLERAVQKWAGVDVEVLIVDCTAMEVILDRR